MKKLILSVTVTLILAFFLTGCLATGNSKKVDSGQPPSASTELKKVKVATSPGTPHSNPWAIAVKKGWFKEEGLDVEILNFTSGPPMMEALASGAWDVGSVGVPGWLIGAKSYNLHWVALGAWDEYDMQIFVRPDSDIARAGKGNIPNYPEIYGKPEHWKGKNFLLPIATNAHMLLIGTLKAMGLTDKDVTLTNMEVQTAFTGFKANKGDGVGLWGHYSVQARKEGWIPASSATAVGYRVPIVIAASEKAMKEMPDVVKKVVKVYYKASTWQLANPEEAAQIMEDYHSEQGFKLSKEDALQMIKVRPQPSLDEQYQLFQQGQLAKMAREQFDFFVSQGRYKPEEWDKISKYINPSVLDSLRSQK